MPNCARPQPEGSMCASDRDCCQHYCGLRANKASRPNSPRTDQQSVAGCLSQMRLVLFFCVALDEELIGHGLTYFSCRIMGTARQ